ncbi:Alpha/Beta hydrolase protein [Calycina marina]|uniref:Alpha/Beta hydrolase protein n=1 Tax=Calycina marina TaxID=1763456 RepID=A0A9P7YW44_9HELO|nr:Alpha/Beta hydrolase protein [Calycina marina]
MSPTSGILYVTMQHKASLPLPQFHDWYNNEHGPTRLRLPFCSNGFRYQASDLEKPEWMAVYDITDMAELTRHAYLRLRDQPVKSKREADTMAQIAVDRKLYDFVECREAEDFMKLEDLEAEGKGNVVVAVFLEVNEEEGNVAELNRWYREEHMDMLSKVPGWLRTRRFVNSSVDPEAPREFLALYDYAPENGLAGEEFKAATSTAWAKNIMSKVVKGKRRRVYDLFYTFGSAPRYLQENLSDWKLTDPESLKTKTISESVGGAGAIESWVTTKDGVNLPFRLEGSADPAAPLIVLSNSILVDYGIWNGFISEFFAVPENKKYRVLRYLTRGRSSNCGSQPVTIDVLASDIITLLDTLRVKKAAAIIGVSLGGATVLNTSLKYPERIQSFISCDTNSKSPAGNSKAWDDRIAMSENEGATASGESIVGSELAEITTRRWFVPASYDGGEMEKTCLVVKKMVETNNREGFRKSVNALFEYDLEEEMKTSEVKAAFVVGGSDGVLPGTMKEMARAYGKGAEYQIIEGAGHLPMVEKPKDFAGFVTAFLG